MKDQETCLYDAQQWLAVGLMAIILSMGLPDEAQALTGSIVIVGRVISDRMDRPFKTEFLTVAMIICLVHAFIAIPPALTRLMEALG